MDDYYVRDDRNAKVKLGPYDRAEAIRTAVMMNDFVRRNAGIEDEPFYTTHYVAALDLGKV